MTYVGQQPATTFDSGIQDRFTGLTTNTVTLNHEISAEEDILVVWNNIVQDKNTYSVGGTGNKTVTLGGTLVSADVVTVYYLNKVMQSVNPTAGSVGITELNVSDGSNGQALTTNGSGTLAFSTISADADNYFASSGLSSKDLGSGLHIKTGDSGLGAVGANYDELIIEGSGRTGMNFLTPNNTKAEIMFSDADTDAIGGITYDHSDDSMGFAINNSERISIDSSGHVGINFTSAHDNALKIENGTDSEWVISMRHSDADNPLGIQIYYSGGAPDGSGDKFIRCLDTGGERFQVLSDGDCNNHDNSFGSISDERIKQNITDASSQWDDIKAVKVRKFKMKDDIRQYGDDAWDLLGVVAQELEASGINKLVKEIEPSSSDILSDSSFGTLYQDGDELPKGKEVGDVKTVNAKVKHVKYSILYMKAIKALQEAQTRIETLETKVKTLEDA